MALIKRATPRRSTTRRVLLVASFVVLCWLLGMGGLEAQSGDDHGNYLDTATTLSLGSSINGRIDPGDDRDIFRLDLSGRFGATDVWIYTTGDFDTLGALYDSRGNRLVVSNDGLIEPDLTNFHIRIILPPGVYHVGVSSADDTSVGDYTLHARAVADPGGSINTATTLSLDVPTPGGVGSDSDLDYFRMDFTNATDLVLYALIPSQALYHSGTFLRYVGHVDVQVFDGQGNKFPVNIEEVTVVVDVEGVLSRYRLYVRISDSFGPGTYYFEVYSPERAIPSTPTRILSTRDSLTTAKARAVLRGSPIPCTDANGTSTTPAGRISTLKRFGRKA